MTELRTLFFALLAGGVFCLFFGRYSGPGDHTICWVVSGVCLFLFAMIIGVLINEGNKPDDGDDSPIKGLDDPDAKIIRKNVDEEVPTY